MKPRGLDEVASHCIEGSSGPLGCAAASSTKDVVDGDRTAPQEDQSEGQGGGRQRKLKARVVGGSDEAIVQVHFPDGHRQVDTDGEGSGASKQSGKDQQSSKKLGERGDVA